MSWILLTSLAHQAGLEEHVGAAKALAADYADTAIWQLPNLLFVRSLHGSLRLGDLIRCDVRQLLLDIVHDFVLRDRGRGVADLRQMIFISYSSRSGLSGQS